MIRILTIVGHYLPGYKAGGPIRTLANLVDWLGDEFAFEIITSDRDLGDTHPYPRVNKVENVGRARVHYLPPAETRPSAWRNLLNTLDYDILYLNSFFAQLTVLTVALRRLHAIPDRPVIVAPRGEFASAALALKPTKKSVYRAAARTTGLYRNVIWQASSAYERSDILARFGPDPDDVLIAPDLARPTAPNQTLPLRAPKQSGAARIVFVGRVARMKNLDFALRLLDGVRGDIAFDLYGPIEDEAYWRECQALIAQLPAHIVVQHHGALPAEQVDAVFAAAHLFLFPTRGENFGHVILEALRAGCPALISDRTPWRNLAGEHAGWDFPLDAPERFRAALADLVAMDADAFGDWSRGARQMGEQYAQDRENVEANRQLFLRALSRR